MQNQPFKLCPNCGQAAVLSMAVCGRCGYRYQSPQSAPLQTTQVVTPPPFFNGQALGVQPDPRSGYGPRDRVEVTFSLFWHWVGLFLSTGVFLFLLRDWLGEMQKSDNRTNGFLILFLLLFACLANFCALRLRRLYLFYAVPQRRWWIPAGIVGLLLVLVMNAPQQTQTQETETIKPPVVSSNGDSYGPIPIPYPSQYSSQASSYSQRYSAPAPAYTAPAPPRYVISGSGAAPTQQQEAPLQWEQTWPPPAMQSTQPGSPYAGGVYPFTRRAQQRNELENYLGCRLPGMGGLGQPQYADP